MNKSWLVVFLASLALIGFAVGFLVSNHFVTSAEGSSLTAVFKYGYGGVLAILLATIGLFESSSLDIKSLKKFAISFACLTAFIYLYLSLGHTNDVI